MRDLPALLEQAELPSDAVTEEDIRQLSDAADDIVAETGKMLDRVRRGELAHAAEPDETGLARTGWL